MPQRQIISSEIFSLPKGEKPALGGTSRKLEVGKPYEVQGEMEKFFWSNCRKIFSPQELQKTSSEKAHNAHKRRSKATKIDDHNVLTTCRPLQNSAYDGSFKSKMIYSHP